MCPGTKPDGDPCRARSRDWCCHHSDQKDLVQVCAGLRSDGERCTREAAVNGFCDLASHSRTAQCKGYASFDVSCRKSAIKSGFCLNHKDQKKTPRCKGLKGNGVKCIAKANASGYCSILHDPTFERFVLPDNLRVAIRADQRAKVSERCKGMDAYTSKAIENKKHLDHVVELQLAADCISNAWRSRRNNYQADTALQDAIELIRDGPANAITNLRDTSAYINLLKGEACKQIIEARHTGDIVETFTTTLMQANCSRFKDKKLSRDTSRVIRKMLKSELKNYWHQIEVENDNNLVLDAIVEEFKSLRVAVNK